MKDLNDPDIGALVARLRSERVVLDELNAEYRRVRKAHADRWAKMNELADALKTNPNRETCDAYFGLTEAAGKFNFALEEAIDGRRRMVRDNMEELQKQLLALLGIGRTNADYDRS